MYRIWSALTTTIITNHTLLYCTFTSPLIFISSWRFFCCTCKPLTSICYWNQLQFPALRSHCFGDSLPQIHGLKNNRKLDPVFFYRSASPLIFISSWICCCCSYKPLLEQKLNTITYCLQQLALGSYDYNPSICLYNPLTTEYDMLMARVILCQFQNTLWFQYNFSHSVSKLVTL